MLCACFLFVYEPIYRKQKRIIMTSRNTKGSVASNFLQFNKVDRNSMLGIAILMVIVYHLFYWVQNPSVRLISVIQVLIYFCSSVVWVWHGLLRIAQ